MIFNETSIQGAYVIEIEKWQDERGFFGRAFCEKEFAEQQLAFTSVQANVGFSKKKYTVRGLHYQESPYWEKKLVRCVRGSIFDVIVDLRPNSPTYKQWLGIELTSKNYKHFYIPEGCAHGYQTLEDHTEIYYLVSEFYHPEAERGIRWNDPTFGIKWKETEEIIISEKDRQWSDFTG